MIVSIPNDCNSRILQHFESPRPVSWISIPKSHAKTLLFHISNLLLILLMDEILHHLGWLKPYKWWDNHHPWWCRILSINSMLKYCTYLLLFIISWYGMPSCFSSFSRSLGVHERFGYRSIHAHLFTGNISILLASSPFFFLFFSIFGPLAWELLRKETMNPTSIMVGKEVQEATRCEPPTCVVAKQLMDWNGSLHIQQTHQTRQTSDHLDSESRRWWMISASQHGGS